MRSPTPLGSANRAPGDNNGQQQGWEQESQGAGVSGWVPPRLGGATANNINQNPAF